MSTLKERLTLASEALKAKRAAGEIEYVDPIERSARNPQSLSLAIKAMCWECVGRNADGDAKRQIGNCTYPGCSLWGLRPYQNWATDAGASLEPPHDAHHGTSRRAAINGKCAECLCGGEQRGHWRAKIATCPSMFPREQFGLATPTGYRGCPLWPHRPGAGRKT